MIAKITSGSYLKGVLEYNSKKGSLLGVENINGSSDSAIYSTIQAYNNLNDRVEKKNFHVSLNFPKEENVDDNKLLNIGKEYMSKLGYADQPFVIYRHYDRSHPHIHIVSSRINEKGLKVKDSNEFYRSKTLCEDLEIKHNLIKAKGRKESNYTHKIDELINLTTLYVEKGRGEAVNLLENVFQHIYGNDNIQNKEDLRSSLKLFNVGYDELDINGKQYISYYFFKNNYSKDQEERIGKRLKPSLLYNNPNIQSIDKLFKSNQIAQKKSKKILKRSIVDLFKKSSSLIDFNRELSKINFNIKFFKNDEDVIYGARLIDKFGKEYKGSELGISISQIKTKFSTNEILNQIKGQKKIGINFNQDTSPSDTVTKINENNENQISLMKELLTFIESYAGDDTGEETSKKKKKRRKRI